MDYSKSGAPKPARKETRHQERQAKGNPPTPGGRATKAELLARMKATAEAKKQD
jgi:hypothetical protein